MRSAGYSYCKTRSRNCIVPSEFRHSASNPTASLVDGTAVRSSCVRCSATCMSHRAPAHAQSVHLSSIGSRALRVLHVAVQPGSSEFAIQTLACQCRVNAWMFAPRLGGGGADCLRGGVSRTRSLLAVGDGEERDGGGRTEMTRHSRRGGPR
ncbi:hypothetical protein EXIGLDRAFT_111872 [Exidia glandulosa HHB12029]|uniref:Uncharacterized protein n=1 Tax=Exidia glandulosa HHB12029 TaxID=1314781 RepID=A0A165NLB5_EXIGL|nr:hypothetical protein EXIGLDRAFT_111872 [Exidia glandulosa HHB12029]